MHKYLRLDLLFLYLGTDIFLAYNILSTLYPQQRSEEMAEKTPAQKKAQQKYMEQFSVARVRMERHQYETVQDHAASRGESTNGFINRAIKETMERDNSHQ